MLILLVTREKKWCVQLMDHGRILTSLPFLASVIFFLKTVK